MMYADMRWGVSINACVCFAMGPFDVIVYIYMPACIYMHVVVLAWFFGYMQPVKM